MQLVQAGQEEEEGADRVEEGDAGVEQVACEHGGQGHAEERGGEHHVEGGLDEEAGEAGEEAGEGDDFRETFMTLRSSDLQSDGYLDNKSSDF